MIRALLKGIRAQKDKDLKEGQVHAAVDGEVPFTSTCKKVGGGHIDITYDLRNFRAVYRDEYTNEILPEKLVREAIREELNYFNSKVWEITDIAESRKLSDPKVVRCR